MSTITKFKKDTFSNYLLLFGKLLLSIVVVPVYLSHFGQELYGIYLLSFGFVSILSFINLGAGKTILRYSAEYKEDKLINKFQGAISNSISLYIIGSVLIFVIFLLLARYAVPIFNISPKYANTSFWLFIMAGLYALIFFFQQIPINLLQGFQIFSQRNYIQFLLLFLNALIYILLVIFQFNILIFSLLIIFNQLVSLSIDIYIVKKYRLLDGVKLTFVFNKSLYKSEYSRFSRNSFFINIIALLSQNADKAIISTVLSAKYVTLYVIITKPYFVLKSLMGNMYTVLQPILVKHTNAQDQTNLKKIFIDFTRITYLIVFPIILMVIINLKGLIKVWLKTDSYNSELDWGILALANLAITLSFSVFTRQLSLSDRSGVIMKLEFVSTSFNFLISILLTHLIGIGGVIIGTSVQFLIATFFVNRYVLKLHKIKLHEIYSSATILFFVLVITVSMILTYVYNNYLVVNGFVELVRNIIVTLVFICPIQVFYLKKFNLLFYLFRNKPTKNMIIK